MRISWALTLLREQARQLMKPIWIFLALAAAQGAQAPPSSEFPTVRRLDPSADELIELSDRWRPYRSLAVSYLFASEYEG